MKILAVSALLSAAVALSIPAEETNLVKRSSPVLVRNGRKFTFMSIPRTWYEAEKMCKYLGGDLASVHDSQEYQAIQRLILIRSHSQIEAWIGGFDFIWEGTWMWSDGSPFTYTDWCRGEPNNYRGKQHCLKMNHSGSKCWDDEWCDRRLPYVCAKTRK